jgi:hypothetical protein
VFSTDAISYVSDKGMIRCPMRDRNHTKVWFVGTGGRFLQAGHTFVFTFR